MLRPFSAKGYSLQLNLQPEAAALLSLSGIRYRTKPLEITCLEASGGSSGSGSGAGGAAYAAGAGIARELPPHIKSQLQQALLPERRRRRLPRRSNAWLDRRRPAACWRGRV